ncbi:expressed unknown protein [Seminavis robusta]|uniref:Uncharacterized protein n=1 Tax=Seminavis robusta TaxID=568900 RepID=A0A9N8E4A8_9STRA|nr:expressed unknown protein [Seminavis robusta]|eukprot:Sro537_g162270.1 n/a (250) ;mRNA; f:7430-8275
MGRTSSSLEIPEAQGLTWRDTFFDNDTDVIAVFDFDYEAVQQFQRDVCGVTLLIPPIGCFAACCCVPCMYTQQIEWDTYSKHVCITQDGIKFVKDKRKSMCGFSFQDLGKESKTVPFDKITDCDVTEPAGATCFCIENVLPVLNVDTASSGNGGDSGPRHELSLSGLEKPLELKNLAWAMKRAQAGGGTYGSGGAAATPQQHQQQSFPQAPAGGTMNDRGDSSETNALLKDIRQELRELNKQLRKQSSS